MKKNIFLLLILAGLFSNLSGADTLYYLNENFVGSGVPNEWENDPYIVNKQWLISYGGQENGVFYVKPIIGDQPSNPESPMDGSTSNIGLYFEQFPYSDTIKLVTSIIELDGSVKPTLRFWHCQYPTSDGVDNLRLFFRPGPNSDWYLIETWNGNVTTWTGEEIDIEERGRILFGNSNLFLTDTFQIGFEGIVGPGRGVYLDSVSVREDDVVAKYVKRITYNSLDYTVIPSGATNIPLEEVIIKIVGNTGDAVLNNLTIVPTGVGIDHLQENSFQLLTKSNDNTVAPTVLATASLSGGEVAFTGIDEYLDLGENTFVVSASFKSDVVGQTQVQFSIPAFGISVSDTLLPISDVLLSEVHTIKEAIFYDDFESGGSSWSLQGDFEVGVPTGALAGGYNNPFLAFNGNNILATNLDGGYTSGISSGSEYFAYTPELDLTYYINPGIYLQQYFNFYGQDSAVVELSIDGGSNWIGLWQNSEAGTNIAWTEYYNTEVNQLAKHQPQFQLRFGIASSVNSYPGFSIDNFAIIAEKLQTDVGITQVLQPYDDCLDCGNDTVKILVENFADGAAPDTIPVYFGLYGQDSTLVRDTIFGGIAKDASRLFVFSKQANFPKADYYNNFIIGIDLDGDQDPVNDTITVPIIIQKNLTPITFEDFEINGGMWLPSEGSSWSSNDMSGTITTDPLSPTIWVLSPYGNYSNNDTMWVTSGCYNLQEETRNIVSFKYWSDSETEKDGARFEYSIDDGISWNILEDPLYGDGWGWHSDTVEALSSMGWAGSHVWTDVQALLPEAVDNIEKAKFRMLFMSNATDAHAQGFAFNDMSIFPAPQDIGVSSIVSPIDACEGINGTAVEVRVKNYGYNKLSTNDTVIVGIDFQSELPFIDTLVLASDLQPGDSVDLVVNTNIDIATAGTYSITAYTLIEDDPWFYQGNNDTTYYSFDVWANPTIILADTIGSRQPDTVFISPVYPDWEIGYSYSWSPGGFTDSIYDVDLHGYGDTIYKILVTEPVHSCTTLDSVNVLLLYFDAGVDTLISPLSNCVLTDTVVTIRVKNTGTDSLLIGDQIEVFYQVNGGTIYTDTITLTQVLRAPYTIEHEFTQDRYDFSVVQDYEIKTWGYYLGGDEDASNDSTVVTVSHHGYTPLDLGPDVIATTLDYTLDAGASFDTYQWSTGDETQTLFLDASISDRSGEYYVDAVDGNACPSSDTINVFFKIRDIKADALVSPKNGCSRIGTDIIEIRVVNNGTDTIKVTDNIIYSYQIDGGTIVIDTIHPSSVIRPNAQYSEEIGTGEDFTSFRSYTVDITATVIGDLRLNNDSLTTVVTTNESPVVDLGDYPDPIYNPSFELDAGAGAFDYLWQDNATITQSYSATSSGVYSVSVTDPLTGCVGYDTTTLTFDIVDYAIKEFTGIGDEICGYANDEIIVSIANLGNQSRFNTEVQIGFVVEDGLPVIETHTISGEWKKGIENAKAVTLTNKVSFEGSGTKWIKVYSAHVADVVPENDTLEEDRLVKESPIVDFGGDTIQAVAGSNLDPGVHSTYEWHDKWTGRYFEVYPVAFTYTVTVTDADKPGCVTTKKVFVEEPSAIFSPTMSDNSGAELNIYPNPANEYLNIEANVLNGQGLIIEIYNMANQLVWSDQQDGYGTYTHKLDISSFNEGVYIIRLRNDKVSQVKRFIVR
jgi:hypothetical protein